MRLRLGLGLLVVLGLGLGLKVKLLSGLIGENTRWTLIGIDGAALLLLLVYSVAALTSHLARLREMLSSLDIYLDGRHDHRLPVYGTGLLTDLSRRINDVLAHDAEDERMDSATPGIKRVVRPGEVTDPAMRALLIAPPNDPEGSASVVGREGVGPVRVRRRGDGDPLEHYDTEVSHPAFDDQAPEDAEDSAHPALAQANAPSTETKEQELSRSVDEDDDDEIQDPSDRDADQMAEDLAVNVQFSDAGMTEAQAQPAEPAEPAAPASAGSLAPPADDEMADDSPSTADSDAQPADKTGKALVKDLELSSEDLRRQLFKDYLQAKQDLGESIEEDLDFAKFNADLDELAANIIRDRGCEDVRFEVRVQNNSVALQPRLVRGKSQPPSAY